ncbi:MAG: bacillithiol system redox-active protein YtxJ [Rhodothermales bacterium]|nr:bacillithiol system redox-active protein YtxJ [Rhodothermales bacterium]
MNRFFKRFLGESIPADEAGEAQRGFSPLESETDWTRALEHSRREPVIIYKHSTSCGISAGARRRLLELGLAGDPPVYEVVIQQARPLSHSIAATLGVRHESPQAIVLHEGQAVFHTSHGSITPDRLRTAVNEIRNA